MLSRRSFVGGGAACLASTDLSRAANANPLGLPVGLQLYSIANDLKMDFDGTLRRVAAIGYREVEFAGFAADKSPEALLPSLRDAGLHSVSAHYTTADLETDLARKIAFARALGLTYMICSFPKIAQGPTHATLDDWKWHAEFFNKVGAETKKAGIQFGYHNHNIEFRRYGGITAFDTLIGMTDPDLVKLEMDCGWVATAGLDPAELLVRHPGRFRLLHVKDIKAGSPANTELKIQATIVGQGSLDWKAIFDAAGKAGITGYYVELEPPYARPPLDEAKASYDYLHGLMV